MAPMTDIELQELNAFCVRFQNAKQSVSYAKKQQTDAKQEIANRVPSVGDAQQRTVTLLDGSKLVVKRGFNTSVNVAGIEALFAGDPAFVDFPPPVQSVTTTTKSLDAKGYEWYRVNHPSLFTKIAEHVTLKPKEVGVTINPAKKEE